MTSLARPRSPFLGDDPVDRAFWHLLLFAETDDAPAPETVQELVTAAAAQSGPRHATAPYRRYRDGAWHAVSRASRRHPTAVHLYDAGETAEVLCLDLDARGSYDAADVALQAAELTQLLQRCGLRWIADLSTSGGVHVLVRLDRRRPRAELRVLQTELRRRYPTIDPAVMAGAAAMLTMPGSVCKPRPGDSELHHRRLLGPNPAARLSDWLCGPSEPAAFTSFLEHLGLPGDLRMFTTETNEGIPRGRPAGDGDAEGSPTGLPAAQTELAEAAIPVRRWPVQRQFMLSPDAVPAAVAELARTGVHHSGDRSRGAWAVVCAVIEAGWSREAWCARVASWPELAGYRALRGHKGADLAAVAAAEWDRAWVKGVRPLAGSRAVRLISGEVRLSVEVGAWVGAAYEVLDLARATRSLRVDAAANVRALVQGLARLGAERGVEFHQALRGMGAVAGLSRSGVEHARDWLRAQGLLVTEAQRPDLTRREVSEEDWTKWTLVVPDGVTAEPVSAVPILEPLWAALGWVHRDVWAAVWRVESLGELAAEVWIANRGTLSAYLARLAEVGLYRPVPRKLGAAVPLGELDDRSYEDLCGEWRTISETLRADGWGSVMARQAEVGAVDTVVRLREVPEIDAAWRTRDAAREAWVDLSDYAVTAAARGESIELAGAETSLRRAEARLDAAIAASRGAAI